MAMAVVFTPRLSVGNLDLEAKKLTTMGKDIKYLFVED